MCNVAPDFPMLQKSYETKQYKKGLKAADTILKKFPDHGGKCNSIMAKRRGCNKATNDKYDG